MPLHPFDNIPSYEGGRPLGERLHNSDPVHGLSYIDMTLAGNGPLRLSGAVRNTLRHGRTLELGASGDRLTTLMSEYSFRNPFDGPMDRLLLPRMLNAYENDQKRLEHDRWVDNDGVGPVNWKNAALLLSETGDRGDVSRDEVDEDCLVHWEREFDEATSAHRVAFGALLDYRSSVKVAKDIESRTVGLSHLDRQRTVTLCTGLGIVGAAVANRHIPDIATAASDTVLLGMFQCASIYAITRYIRPIRYQLAHFGARRLMKNAQHSGVTPPGYEEA